MTGFAIYPPVHLRAHPDVAIRSLDEAAEVVRGYARDHFDSNAESLLHRLEGANDLARSQGSRARLSGLGRERRRPAHPTRRSVT
jgi:hypothetical protein